LGKIYNDQGKYRKSKKFFKITEKFSNLILFHENKEKETYILVDHILMSLISNIVLNKFDFKIEKYVNVIKGFI
jgi:hypothetical protein